VDSRCEEIRKHRVNRPMPLETALPGENRSGNRHLEVGLALRSLPSVTGMGSRFVGNLQRHGRECR
jgi:hypothetical protein